MVWKIKFEQKNRKKEAFFVGFTNTFFRAKLSFLYRAFIPYFGFNLFAFAKFIKSYEP